MGFGDYVKKEEKPKKKVEYEVKKVIGAISSSEKETKDLRRVSWNNGEDKFDIRKWSTKDGEEKAGSGITLTVAEIENLYELLKSMQES